MVEAILAQMTAPDWRTWQPRAAKERSVAKFLELFFAAGGGPTAEFVDRLIRVAADLADRARRHWQRRDGRLPGQYRSNNHLRQDVGLPPISSRNWPH